MPQRVDPLKSAGLIRARPRAARSRTDKFSPTILRLSWVVFILLHTICFVYFAIAGWCYWNLPGTRLAAWLSMVYIGIGTEYDRMVGVVHGSIAVVHAAYIVWMVGWSIKKKSLVFAVYNVVRLPANTQHCGDNCEVSWSVKEGLFWFYRAVFTRDGLLGVDGANFDLILLCREIVETALQTQQGYRMSLLLPRTLLNRGYVILLVINCWTTAIVHSYFSANSTKRRLVTLICDCVLDLVSSVGISTALVAIYTKDFDFKINGFPFLKWYEDVWRVYAMSEFQLIFVSSWEDMGMRIMFALSVLGNLNNMKKLMRAKSAGPMVADKNGRHRATAVAPFHANLGNVRMALPQCCGINSVVLHRWAGKFTEVVFFAWGLTILVLHLHAESAPRLPQCRMQVKPWVSTKPSCSLLELNCYESGFNGTKSEIAERWSAFDPTTVVRAVIRHCPALEMPTTLTEFSQLKELKLYNTTVLSWDENAALTHLKHPRLTTLFLVRVNLTDHELPLGLQSLDFPQMLDDIEFCVTNCRTLPEDIDMKWPQYSSIYLEACEFEEVPPPLVRLAPYDLSLSMNPISEIPSELFESDSVGYLSFGGTQISQLPVNVTEISLSMVDVNLSNTNISYFWAWIDQWVIIPSEYPHITAGNTPYCRDIENIFRGEQFTFSDANTLRGSNVGLSSVLLDASAENWGNLKSAVSCKVEGTYYPLSFEDKYSSIGSVGGSA